MRTVIFLALLFSAACGGSDTGQPAAAPPPASAPPAGLDAIAPPLTSTTNDCQRHVEVLDAAAWAKEFGESEAWVLANHRVNLWAASGENRGRKTGELLVGSRAVILDENDDAYRVRSPLDGSTGWVSKIQVARTLQQNVKTREACTP